ncbi:MAG: PAS domain S-box protein [Planctomycetaceae bacterium]|nr:PAS domain S-box protein [Planctomycetaceae bacterium]
MPRALILHHIPTEAAALMRAMQSAGCEVEVAVESNWNSGRVDAKPFDLVVTTGSDFADLVERCAEESALRQSIEAALLDAEAMYRSFAEGLPIHLLCKNREGRFTFANGLFCRELGKSLAEITGKTDFDFFSNELAEKYQADDQRVTQTLEVFRDVEEHRLPSGEKRHVEVLKAPIYNAAGDVAGVQVAFWDVTDRIRAEEEINRKNRDLETLLYVTSHDLREPLRAIRNFAKLVSERYAPKLDERGQDYLRRVVRGAERLDRLLDDVLTLSRAQRSVEIAADVDVSEVVADVLAQLEGRIERTRAEVQVAADLPRLSADRRWVTQAVYHLVINALKFTKPGEAPQVTISAYRPGPTDRPGRGVVVADRGPGVPAGYSERIFQLFQRAVGRDVEGTGAGLAIVRQIAERHEGTAWVRPRDEGGSEFVVTFGDVVN